jgi:hypothetical protein
MMRIAAGEVPGRDLNLPWDLIPEIEFTDKAVARLKQQNPRYKRIIMRYWMGHVPIFVIAAELRSSEDRTKELLQRAEFQVGRNILHLENLTETTYSAKIVRVQSRKVAL